MARDDVQLQAAKRSYKQASINGNHQEEARWANVIGDILKQRGEYVEALRWLRVDYEVSRKHLPEKQLLPTCQSLGEVYLRLQHFEQALLYQKKHLELAKDANDLVEQQRASTQLGRTYHELFCRSENDHYAVRKAKKCFLLSMELARTLKENPLPHKSSFFLKEFIDAHNNLGMLEMDMDNLDEAKKYLLKGLKICDDEEVIEDDDARSRLHHNLGSLYIELRAWDKAREHIERDILICKKISHPQGEAKGYINLGELHYRVQKYDEAVLCYQKALDIARPMEDEDALVEQINQNIKTVSEASKVLEELRKEELVLKRLTRTTMTARGTADERRCLLQQDVSLDRLIEKSSMIFAWTKHREYAKRKKRVTNELCDKEKLSDSFLAIGESYQKLRNFNKAHKWYLKSWNAYRSIGNVEGQALTKINIGEVLDSAGDWAGALEAFKEGNRIAAQGKLLSVRISALENMHYSYMIRFDNVEEARRLHGKTRTLKQLLNNEAEVKSMAKECCSETETQGCGLSDNGSDASDSLRINSPVSRGINKPLNEFTDDFHLVSQIPPSKKSKTNMLQFCGKNTSSSGEVTKASSEDTDNQQPIGRKRVRVVLSDDEVDKHDPTDNSSGRLHTKCPVNNKVKRKYDLTNPYTEFQDVSHTNAPKDVLGACTTIHLEESACSFKPDSPNYKAGNVIDFKSFSAGEFTSASKPAASASKLPGGHVLDNVIQCQNDTLFCSEHQYSHSIALRIGDDIIHVEPRSCLDSNKLSVECLKVEVARICYLQLSDEKQSKGLLPIIRHLKCGGKVLESLESLEDFKDFVGGERRVDVAIDGWVPKRLMKIYIDHCKKLFEAPNMKLLMKLYHLEVTEDEIIASDCELQDISISPFLDALCEHKTIATLDLSHNSLGNETMLKLKQIFSSSSHKYRGLTLDLHCNRFGPTSLFQICECPELFSRLEVLNLSGNRLTDSCGSYLSTILDNCKALYSLNIEQCSITSRTIQKVADALNAGSVLAELCIGRNNPISGNAMCSLLSKLSILKRFSEINLSGVKISKPTVDSLCQFAKSSNLSGLMLGSTYIGVDGAVHITETLARGPQELVKLDLSCTGLTFHATKRICENIVLAGSVLELNLGGNSILQEGSESLASLLLNPQCCLKVLVLNKCYLGLTGVLKIIQALAENNSLEELNLAENADLAKGRTIISMPKHASPNCSLPEDVPTNICVTEEVKTAQQGLRTANSNVEVAYTEDNPIRDSPISSLSSDSMRLSQGTGLLESQLIQDLAVAIGSTKHLQLLDLSLNGFSRDVAEILHSAWASISCGRLVRKHIDVNTIHFLAEGKNCCGVRTCCRRY